MKPLIIKGLRNMAGLRRECEPLAFLRLATGGSHGLGDCDKRPKRIFLFEQEVQRICQFRDSRNPRCLGIAFNSTRRQEWQV